MNTKLVAGLVVIVLLMGVGSFTFVHTADAEKSTHVKKTVKIGSDKAKSNALIKANTHNSDIKLNQKPKK